MSADGSDEGDPARRPRGPHAARFAFGTRRSLDVDPATPDYLADASIWRRTYIRAIEDSVGAPIDTTTSWFIGPDAAVVRLTSQSCTETFRSEEDAALNGLDGLAFEFVVEGECATTIAGHTVTAGPGDLTVMRTMSSMLVRTRRVRMASVYVPAYRLAETLGAPPPEDLVRNRRLTDTPLARFATAQLRLLFDEFGRMEPEDYASAMEAAASLLVGLVGREVARARLDAPDERRRFERIAAFLEGNCRRHDLAPDTIAAAVGMSRTALYRLFAEHGLGVARYLRDLRLRKFVDDLRASDAIPIAAVAYGCGLDMSAADLSRMFKRAYGMTPRQARETLRRGQEVTRRDEAAPEPEPEPA